MEFAKVACLVCVRRILSAGVPSSILKSRSPISRYLSTVSQPERSDVEFQTTVADKRKSVLDPLQHPDYFRVHELFTVQDLFEARVHLGHKEGSLDDRMKPFVFGSRLSHLVFDLDLTAHHLRRALNFTAHVAFNGGVVLFVYRGAHSSLAVERAARECGEFAHTRFWRGGTFTNSERQFGTVTRLPDLCVFFSTLNTILSQHNGVLEAAKMAIPSVGIVDTNCNPNLVTYPVPGNDDTPCAIALYCKLFTEAIRRGKEERARVLQLAGAELPSDVS
ncbi:small ribosomal subunit protein uS2m [Bacillus rossius redtenbacheri]|uniref:small ribosomal subunit protein uS2m n=1 Tax=Bacillus rossius redtenbacheri TaxID=93214 RepID=UPI002FDE5B56